MLVTDWPRNQHRHSQTSCLGIFSASFCQVTGPSRIQGQPWPLWALSWNIFVVVCLFVWPEYCSFIFLKNVASGYLEVRLWEVQELPMCPWERSAMKPFPDSSTEPKPYDHLPYQVEHAVWAEIFLAPASCPLIPSTLSLYSPPHFLCSVCPPCFLCLRQKSHYLKMVPDWP